MPRAFFSSGFVTWVWAVSANPGARSEKSSSFFGGRCVDSYFLSYIVLPRLHFWRTLVFLVLRVDFPILFTRSHPISAHVLSALDGEKEVWIAFLLSPPKAWGFISHSRRPLRRGGFGSCGRRKPPLCKRNDYEPVARDEEWQLTRRTSRDSGKITHKDTNTQRHPTHKDTSFIKAPRLEHKNPPLEPHRFASVTCLVSPMRSPMSRSPSSAPTPVLRKASGGLGGGGIRRIHLKWIVVFFAVYPLLVGFQGKPRGHPPFWGSFKEKARLNERLSLSWNSKSKLTGQPAKIMLHSS